MSKDHHNLYILYYTLCLDEEFDYKSIIKSESKEGSKKILFSKLSRDFLIFEVKNIKSYKLNPNFYKGKRLSDKELEILNRVSYPNTKHKLYKFEKNQWFKSKSSKNRNKNGRFKKGFVPWNKDLKMQFLNKKEDGKFISSRDSKGRLKSGYKSVIIGNKNL
jgi:hypothetical protein